MGLIIWSLVGAFVAFFVFRTAWLLAYQRYLSWELQQRRGLSYYGKPLAQRQQFKEELKRRSAKFLPLIRMEVALKTHVPSIPSLEYQGVYGPTYSCTRESFDAAATYQPTKDDIFVATQMKCGTTWMQQVVYEILSRGDGDLGDSGHGHLYAASPWIEAVDSVSMKAAPLIGPSRKRIIKTHMPTKLLQYSPQAKYIYVTRHPVACYASIVDYFDLMAGPFVPPRPMSLEWYCSDKMWWLPWPEHVAGYWDWAQEHPENVLFVHFEEMKKDLEGAVRSVAKLLGEPLTDAQVTKVAQKSGFQWMKDHEDLFEMCPPNMFSVSGTYFKSGQTDRDKDVSDADKQRILAFCRERLNGRRYPAAQFYPALAGPSATR